MIDAIAVDLLRAWALCAAVQAALWLVAQRTKNAAIVDAGWAGTFALVVALYAVTATAPAASGARSPSSSAHGACA